MNELEELRNEIDRYQQTNNIRFNRLENLVNQLAEAIDIPKVVMKAVTLNDVIHPKPLIGNTEMNIARATVDNRFAKIYANGFFGTTNAFRFGIKDGSPKDSFIRMQVKPDGLLVGYRRNAENTEDSYGNPVETFASAFPCVGKGAFNGRECSDEYDMPILEGVKREYDYDARDLLKVQEKHGLPVLAKDFPQMNVRAKFESNMYGHSAAFDMYWHRTDKGLVEGHDGTINAIYGSKTKEFNILYWIHSPSNNNAGIELANGWSGAEEIGEEIIGGRKTKIGLKLEDANGNKFLYICLVGEDTKGIDIDVTAINDWLLNRAWDLITNSEAGKRILNRMGDDAPQPPSGDLAYCGGTLGTEIWFSHPDGTISQFEWTQIDIEIDGDVHSLFEARDYPLSQKEDDCATCEPADFQDEKTGEADGIVKQEIEVDDDGIRILRMKVGDIEDIVDGNKIDHLGDDNSVCKEYGTYPNLQVEALSSGETIITYLTEFEADYLHVIVS